MNFKEIQELIRIVSKSDLAEFKMKEADFEISIKTGKSVQAPAAIAPVIAPVIPTTHAIAPSPISPKISGGTDEPAARKTDAGTESGKKLLEIKSPMVGTFYRASGPDKPQFVKIGDTIDVGTTVCIIEAMKLFNEIESEVKGTIVKVMVEDASPVEYDQVLFLVEP
jgi:acetyl-CoA carboxylase biotin carboxyl carrier protein